MLTGAQQSIPREPSSLGVMQHEMAITWKAFCLVCSFLSEVAPALLCTAAGGDEDEWVKEFLGLGPVSTF
ncbi:hypothetical protein TREES_T100015603 [Tupaia chinensis]|uniref:Uncharacterized protein n=1 Tax=Tupaia chinensis TaxID=246437 RepID=L9LBT1_TUPCH|nr:hypothetical protein TREES_T100015603 [Tupaia chinensis]